MKRREFITLLGGAAAWPLAARGLSSRSECDALKRNTDGLPPPPLCILV